jgi:hypothetical protein
MPERTARDIMAALQVLIIAAYTVMEGRHSLWIRSVGCGQVQMLILNDERAGSFLDLVGG